MDVFGNEKIGRPVKISDLYTFLNDRPLNDENDKILPLDKQGLPDDRIM